MSHSEVPVGAPALEGLAAESRVTQRLASIGELSAGIAHEINTPTQFVGDTITFLSEAFEELDGLLEAYREFTAAAADERLSPEHFARLAESEDIADIEYLRERVPAAFRRAQEGVQRVGKIVAAMRSLSPAQGHDKTLSDVNAALDGTLTVARGEFKYVAELQTDFGDIPMVSCDIGEVSEVLLNLVINASHAMQDVYARTGRRGTLTVATKRAGEDVLITIADTGGGIPAEVADRIFEPFFTTKASGRGTGQGLSIARRIVQEHGGQLSFDVEAGHGTTFTICLPIAEDQPQLEVAA